MTGGECFLRREDKTSSRRPWRRSVCSLSSVLMVFEAVAAARGSVAREQRFAE